MNFDWLRSLRTGLFRDSRRARFVRRRRRSSPRLPVAAEVLEDRALLSAPTVISTSPLSNAAAAPVDSDVAATFDQSINPSTATHSTFTVQGSQSGGMTPSNSVISVSGPTVTLNPTHAFHPGEQVQVTATSGLQNGFMTAATPSVWQFTTAAGKGPGTYVDSGQSLGSANSHDVALGDLNGDGYLDAFVANNGANTVWYGNASGTFTNSGQALGAADSQAVALADLNGDGSLDAFVANNGANTVWINDGHGNFTVRLPLLGVANSHDVALGDVDGDGDVDAVVANNGGNTVWTNDGNGNFTNTGQSLGTVDSWGVALADMNGDGNLDAVFADQTSAGGDNPNRVWFNNGSGTFTAGPRFGNSTSTGVALGDLNGDGFADAFVTNSGSPGEADKVWINDGHGSFVDSGQNLGSMQSAGVALGDVNGDGTLDAVVAVSGGAANVVWRNDGSGTFTQIGAGFGTSDSRAVAVGDVDGDGDLDAFVANWNQANTVWLNGGTNTPPTISAIADQSTQPGAAVGPLSFTVGDTQTPAGQLVVRATSSNTTLVPNAKITLGGSGASRTITVTPTAGSQGTATITVTVTDAGGLTAQDTFDVNVSLQRATWFSPNGSSTNTLPSFQWSRVTSADHYELWVDEIDAGGNQIRKAVIHQRFLGNTVFAPFTAPAALSPGRYRAWVRGVTVDGTSGPWSQANDFQVTFASHIAFIAPMSGSSNETAPTFAWTAVAAAVVGKPTDHYDLWVDQVDAQGNQIRAQVIRQQTLTSTSFTPSTGLAPGNYRAWVRPVAADGTQGTWTSPLDFSISSASGAPRFLSPRASTPTDDTTPTFDWTAVSGATQYELWVDRIDAAGNQLQAGVIDRVQSTTVFTPSSGLLGGYYRAWVRQTGPFRGPWSSALEFSIAPQSSRILTPADGNSTTNPAPTFTWTSTAGANHYELWVDEVDAAGNQLRKAVIHETNVSGTSFTPQDGLTAGHYRAWVRPISASGALGPWSGRSDFTVMATAVPQLLLPPTSTGDTTPLFRWTNASGATRYQLWVDKINPSTGIQVQKAVINQYGLTTTQFTPATALATGKYRAWVRATSPSQGAWSEKLEFTIS